MKLENIKIVMVETTHSGNIGAAARAMKNMGLSRLVLVNPKCPIGERAYSRGSGANNILDQRITVDSLAEAIADCQLVAGTSARLRSLAWPELTPFTLAQKVNACDDTSAAAIVFGREHAGLTNEELKHCHYTVTIPTNPDFSSLNVASAIQVVSYEIYKIMSEKMQTGDTGNAEPMADSAQLEGYFKHLEQVLLSTQFIHSDNPRQMMKRLRRIYQRAELSKNEVNILRGILSSVEKFNQ